MAAKEIPFTILRQSSWDPSRVWQQSSRIFDQAFGMPVLAEEYFSWPSGLCPGYLRLPGSVMDVGLFSLFPKSPSAHTLARQLSGGMTDVKQSPDTWKVCLDVNQFTPEELTVRTKDGMVEITGKHEERRDEHGYVSRSFIRKYILPPEVDAKKVTSSFSPDGVLTVEAPLPKPAIQGAEKSIPVSTAKK
ncbi:heat shock protein beta-1-like isoform X2 [Hoplias malabaricus]|uniref:heat shock protein beta-1-like isoform X2 n=1 Tax=Hoplias malabaricus TaxID=27720 RepID=UPI0034619656